MAILPALALTSDWHWAPGAWKRRPEIKGDAFFATSQLVAYCRDNRVDLIGAGDLFDVDHPDSRTLQMAFDFLHEMQASGRRLLFTQGQHEKAYPPWLGLTGYAEHVNRKKIQVKGVTVYGFDHVPADQLQPVIDEIPAGIDLLVCHQVWGDFMGIGAEGQLSQLSKPGGANWILTGDYHQHLTLEVDGMKVLSAGSTCLQEITEPREKEFFVLYDDLCTLRSIPLRSRQVHDVTVRTQEDLERLITNAPALCEPQNGVPEEIAKNIVYVQCGDLPEAFRRVTKRFATGVHLFWKPLIGDRGDILVADEDIAERAPLGLRACLPLIAPEGGPLYNSVLRILNAKDKKAELAAMATEFRRS